MSISKKEMWEKRILKKDSVLDIGCWEGATVRKIKNRCDDVWGIDINKKRLNSAKSDVRAFLKYGDVTKKIPFEKKFNWIILNEVLEHVNDDEKALKNISNSLKKGGKLILKTPKSVPFFVVWDPAWIRWKFLFWERHYHYSKKELFSKLKKYNLNVKKYYIAGNLKWLLYRLINIISKYIFRSEKVFNYKESMGFFVWVVLAEKIK